MRRVILWLLITLLIIRSGLTVIISPEEKQIPSEGLEYQFKADGTCVVTGIGTCTDEKIVIPSEVNGFTVTGIEQGRSNVLSVENVQSIVIPAFREPLKEGAFGYSETVSKVEMKEGTTTVFNNLFGNFPNLLVVSLPRSLVRYSSSILNKTAYFYNPANWYDSCLYCSGHLITASGEDFTECTVLDGTKIIAGGAFFGHTSLETVNIPDSIEYIGTDAFTGTAFYNDDANWDEDGVLYLGDCLISADRLKSKSYTIKPGTKVIAEMAFFHTYGLEEITIPDSVKVICAEAFDYSLSPLKRVNIDSLEQWLSYEFFEPSGNPLFGRAELYINGEIAENIVIPDNVKVIKSGAFAGCSSLKSIDFGKGVEKIDNHAFYGCRQLTSVTLPEKLTCIRLNMFADCTALEEIVIPENVKFIEDNAFAGSALKKVKLPDSVEGIGECAFAYCPELESVELPDSVRMIGDYAFSTCPKLKELNIPENLEIKGKKIYSH